MNLVYHLLPVYFIYLSRCADGQSFPLVSVTFRCWYFITSRSLPFNMFMYSPVAFYSNPTLSFFSLSPSVVLSEQSILFGGLCISNEVDNDVTRKLCIVTSKLCDKRTSCRHLPPLSKWSWRVEIKINGFLFPCRFLSPVIMAVSTDPTYPLFPIFSFLGFIVCCIPLPWHIQAWNSGTCAFIMWTAVACLIEFVNCIIWTGNLNNPAPVWCDICEFAFQYLFTALNLSWQLRKSSWVSASVYLQPHCVSVGASTTLLLVKQFPLPIKMYRSLLHSVSL